MSHLPCPCHSQKCYHECCQPYHQGKNPENALALMRSRYSAYALGLAEYIIATTHSENPSSRKSNLSEWKKDILDFSKTTQFTGLEILDFSEDKDHAEVCFTAFLTMENQKSSFTEKSSFEKCDSKWFYKDGKIVSRS